MREDLIKFYEYCEYIDDLGQVWTARIKDGDKFLWKEDTGWGLWNYGEGLVFSRKVLT